MIWPRIAWALCLIGALLFFLFSASWVALALLVVVMVVPLLLLAINLLTANKIDMSFELPTVGEKDVEFNCVLKVQNHGRIPRNLIACKIHCENLLTGEFLYPKILFPVGSKDNEEVSFALKSRYCGSMKVSVEKPKVYDPFGLWTYRLPREFKGVTCVLPQTFSPHLEILHNLSKDMEADEYSQSKPGSDPSETFAIRDYRPGDSLKQIHWKLSWKFDEMMIKESGMPVHHSFLVLVETATASDEAALEPQVLDAKTEIAVSLCQTLLEAEIAFELAWYDHDEQTFYCRHIANTDDFSGLLTKMMSARNRPHASSAMDRYSEAQGEASFEHVIYVSHCLSQDLHRFAGEGRSTAIICQNNQDFSSVSEANAVTYYCTPDNYQRELVYLEI